MFLVVLSFISPLLTALVHVFLYRFIFHRGPPKSHQLVLIKIILVMTCVYGGCGFAWGVINVEHPLLTTLYALASSLGFQYAYFHLYNMSETARRVRICVSIYCGDGAKIEKEQYNNEQMIETRLERLEHMGALKKQNERYFARESLILRAAKVLGFLHRVYYPKDVLKDSFNRERVQL